MNYFSYFYQTLFPPPPPPPPPKRFPTRRFNEWNIGRRSKGVSREVSFHETDRSVPGLEFPFEAIRKKDNLPTKIHMHQWYIPDDPNNYSQYNVNHWYVRSMERNAIFFTQDRVVLENVQRFLKSKEIPFEASVCGMKISYIIPYWDETSDGFLEEDEYYVERLISRKHKFLDMDLDTVDTLVTDKKILDDEFGFDRDIFEEGSFAYCIAVYHDTCTGNKRDIFLSFVKSQFCK